ncbi:hypothetical protein ACRALDRAFT_1094638 [Sodiomyces alcalophilus JCM 7366]|uniref:uncharacterized protein n=1 Tax=Sodiomyces alcalophilus JCM 7366 TaxID=591952 RepID=UPI0039B377E8
MPVSWTFSREMGQVGRVLTQKNKAHILPSAETFNPFPSPKVALASAYRGQRLG